MQCKEQFNLQSEICLFERAKEYRRRCHVCVYSFTSNDIHCTNAKVNVSVFQRNN